MMEEWIAATMLVEKFVSFVEVTLVQVRKVIKNGLGRADFQVDAQRLRQGLLLHGYEELAISGAHGLAVRDLPALHKDPFEHKLIVRETQLVVPEENPSIQTLYRTVAGDRARGEMIARDVQLALEEGRWPIVLTERKDHLELLRDLICGICPKVVVLRGGPGSGGRARAAAISLSGARSRVIVATGRYVGEGFDDPTLDTLFLAMPISWKGTVIQYAGRLVLNPAPSIRPPQSGP